jgi:hypothetical protein
VIVVLPDREHQWLLLSTYGTPPADRNGYVGAEVARQPDADDAPPRRPIGFRLPEPPTPTPGQALPDWLLPGFDG